jgi:redox-sensitive bicupin YhaK (pirin superfamily)
MQVFVYGPEKQAVGEFDGGKIVEQKPIGFPREGSEVSRVGPLFYWAWMKANGRGHIPLHPHQAFEIMTYVIAGHGEHGDTLGTRSIIGPGGAQVMQTGSGVSHEESVDEQMEGFQIWFEPHLSQSVQKHPTYNQYEHAQFPIADADGATVKTVIGEGAPIHFDAEARMWDVTLPAGGRYAHELRKGYSLAALAVRGGGTIASGGGAGADSDASDANDGGSAASFQHKDFVVLRPEETPSATIAADEAEELHILIIEVPERVNYPLYRK